MKYPCRCKIVDVDGLDHRIGPFTAATPELNKPHIGKLGIAEKVKGKVRITLDDGTVLLGSECWWGKLEGE